MNSQNSIQCPACGSLKVALTYESKTYSVPYASPFELRTEVATCQVCNESGDFRNANSTAIKQAIEEANQASIGSTLEWLSTSGISMAYIERALRLPTRTLARWKSGECSASGIALLSLVRTFPWLLEVAKDGFSEASARRAVLGEASSIIKNAVDAAGFRYSVSALQNEAGSLEVRARFESNSTSTASDAFVSSSEQGRLAA